MTDYDKQIQEFCNIFNLDWLDVEYSNVAETTGVYFRVRAEDETSPFWDNDYPHQVIDYDAVGTDDGELFIRYEDGVEVDMLISQYIDELITEFENDGWVFTDGTWE